MAEIAHTLVIRPTTRAVEVARSQMIQRLRAHGVADEQAVEDCLASVEAVVDHASQAGVPVVTVSLVVAAEDEVVVEVLAEAPPTRPLLRAGAARRVRARIAIDPDRGRDRDVAGAPGQGNGG